MKNHDQLNQLLKQALSPTVKPSEDLNQKIINQLKENRFMKPVLSKRISVAVIAAVVTLAMSITAYAAWQLNSKQVAEHLGNEAIAQAFDDKSAIEINKSVVSGEYNFTLLGITSGKNLSGFESEGELRPDRTYAVVSIAKHDGSKMPDTRDEAYGQVPFFISPLIKGQKPWQVNIASMNGGYSSCVIDGVMYRLIECDGIEMFADRGLYLCISTSTFYDVAAFKYDEKTGEISLNTNYNGANALFDLPLDKAKADHEKAEKYLQELLGEPTEDSTVSDETTIGWYEGLEDGIVIPESIKEVTYDANGLACYEYKDSKTSFNVDWFFEGEQKVTSKIACKQGKEGERTAIQISRDVAGVITGRVIKLN